MDGRTSVWLLSVSLALSSAGCVTTQSQDVARPDNLSSTKNTAESSPRNDGPKRFAQPSTEIKIGQMKEAEADSESGKKNPEAQARLRDEARMAYQQALKVDPGNLDAARSLGKLYTKTGDLERALDTYKKAMAKHPKDAELWYDLGLCHNRRKDFAESVRCFNEALKIDPENRAYLKTLGFTLAYRGQIDQGLTYMIRAQGAALAHYNIARVLVQRDQPDQAQQHLRIALRENGQLEDARELLTALENPNGTSARVTTE
jgi:tetratricopeptide (TPR) repeat protein